MLFIINFTPTPTIYIFALSLFITTSDKSSVIPGSDLYWNLLGWLLAVFSVEYMIVPLSPTIIPKPFELIAILFKLAYLLSIIIGVLHWGSGVLNYILKNNQNYLLHIYNHYNMLNHL